MEDKAISDKIIRKHTLWRKIIIFFFELIKSVNSTKIQQYIHTSIKEYFSYFYYYLLCFFLIRILYLKEEDGNQNRAKGKIHNLMDFKLELEILLSVQFKIEILDIIKSRILF